jgi:hypothetical protein
VLIRRPRHYALPGNVTMLAHLESADCVWFLVLDDDLDAGARLEPRSNAPLVSGWFSARSLTIEQVIRVWP